MQLGELSTRNCIFFYKVLFINKFIEIFIHCSCKWVVMCYVITVTHALSKFETCRLFSFHVEIYFVEQCF